MEETRDFYNNLYSNLGFAGQRKYPQEELCHFVGRNFFHTPVSERRNMKVLETGCGAGANLWMLAWEGFDAYGIDLSSESLKLCQKMLNTHGVDAQLFEQDMEHLDFPHNYFQVVVDVFSSYCLTREKHQRYLENVFKVLKPGGLFFSYFPSKVSDTYLVPEEASFLDHDTLACVTRKTSPFCGQNYPFRFMHSWEYEKALQDAGFSIKYSETIEKTYRFKQEKFGFICIEGFKKM